uniref:Uncharacterized protein n=1 Tax=Glossina austeni TaxID=7395 RepID=A0A1A9UDD3_GLOAU
MGNMRFKIKLLFDHPFIFEHNKLGYKNKKHKYNNLAASVTVSTNIGVCVANYISRSSSNRLIYAYGKCFGLVRDAPSVSNQGVSCISTDCQAENMKVHNFISQAKSGGFEISNHLELFIDICHKYHFLVMDLKIRTYTFAYIAETSVRYKRAVSTSLLHKAANSFLLPNGVKSNL